MNKKRYNFNKYRKDMKKNNRLEDKNKKIVKSHNKVFMRIYKRQQNSLNKNQKSNKFKLLI